MYAEQLAAPQSRGNGEQVERFEPVAPDLAQERVRLLVARHWTLRRILFRGASEGSNVLPDEIPPFCVAEGLTVDRMGVLDGA